MSEEGQKFPLRSISSVFCESDQHESPRAGLRQGNSTAGRLPKTPTNNSMQGIPAQRSVVCIIRTQRHSASAVVGKSARLKATPASVSSRLTDLVRKPMFFRLSESRTQVPTSGLPNFGALAAISTDIRIN